MDKYSFDKINEFCDTCGETVTQSHRDFMIRKFSVAYFSSIEERSQANVPLNCSDENNIRNALLNKTSLENSLIAAKNYYNLVDEQYYQGFMKKVDKTNFWKSVGASILANVIYALLLIVMFFIAKDQVSTWLSSLVKVK